MKQAAFAELAELISEVYFIDELLDPSSYPELVDELKLLPADIPPLVLEAVRIKLSRWQAAH